MNRRKRAFTLIELLTVIAIIALLIAIAVPSLSRARQQARRTKVKSQIHAIEQSVLMFYNDFADRYPDSSPREDRIENLPGGVDDHKLLFGAHWLARVMLGVDLEGIDVGGEALIGFNGGNGLDYADYKANYPRKKPYLDLGDANVARDDDRAKIKDFTGVTATGRYVLLDDYNFPILYYRANPGGQVAFAAKHSDGSAQYYQEDNALFTGTDVPPKYDSWQYVDPIARKTPYHGLHAFGDMTDPTAPPGPPVGTYTDMTFVHYFHNPNVWEPVKKIVKPVAETSFILLSAGPDGLYGTKDDVSNYKIGK